MDITTDRDGRVYVRWHGGGPWTVLDRDGTVTEEVGMGGERRWYAEPLPDVATPLVPRLPRPRPEPRQIGDAS